MPTLPQTPRAYIAVLAVIFCLTGAVAILFGYISPDSWYYMFLAQGLRHGVGCVSGNEYMAIYPCGYPAVLALTAPSVSLPALMVSSKVTNLLLLAGTFGFVWKASGRLVMATVVTVNPVTLNIAMYTWSENLLLFCTCGAFCAIAAINDNYRRIWPYVLLGGVLVLGCFARYFFGPYAFILFLCAFAVYGRWTALRCLPLFALAGTVYLGYLAFNKHMTGFDTGMPRTAAPESLWFLLRQFIVAVWWSGLAIAATSALYLGIARKNLAFERGEMAAPVRFLLLAGIGFLGLALLLRLRTQFDPFDTRTIGYGVVFVLAGLAGWLCNPRDGQAFYPALALVACGLAAVTFSDGWSIPDDVHDMFQDDYAVPALAVSQLQRHGPHYETIVYFRLPVDGLPEGNVDNVEDVYYGDDASLVNPSGWPDGYDTPKSFLKKLYDEDDDSCAFDFTAFSSVADFKTFLDQTYTLDDQMWPARGTAPATRRLYDPALEDYLLKIIRPGQMIPCQTIENLPVSQAVLHNP